MTLAQTTASVPLAMISGEREREREEKKRDREGWGKGEAWCHVSNILVTRARQR